MTVSSEASLDQLLPAWLELTTRTDVALGLEPSEALERAGKLLADLRSGEIAIEGRAIDTERAEVLHALVALTCRHEAGDPKAALADTELVFTYISSLPWPADEFGGPGDILRDCALHGWRLARHFAPWPEFKEWANRIGNVSGARSRAERVLSIAIPERAAEIGLPDERDYFLGEFALTAGTANRVLFRAAEAKLWFQRAEANFALVQNANAHWARVAYQRLSTRGRGAST